MKNLLSLSKQKKDLNPMKPQSNSNKWPPKKVEESLHDSELGEEEEDYEPSQSEILEYAQFIGIDPIREKHLLHVAREGLITPVPPPWEAIEVDDGEEIVYINRQTGEKIWEHPCDELFRELVKEERKKLAKPVPALSSQGVMVAPLKPQLHTVQMEDPLLKL